MNRSQEVPWSQQQPRPQPPRGQGGNIFAISIYVDSIYGRKPQQYVTCQGLCQLRPVANKTSTSFCVQNLVYTIPEGK